MGMCECASAQPDLHSERNILANVSVRRVSACVDALIEPHSYCLEHTKSRCSHMLTDIQLFSTVHSEAN